MRLYLAVAVLMLAFVAYTEAQEETFEQKVTKLGTQVQEKFQELATQFQASEAVTNARNSLTDFWEKVKTQFSQ